MKEIDMSLELVGHTVTFKAYTPNQNQTKAKCHLMVPCWVKKVHELKIWLLPQKNNLNQTKPKQNQNPKIQSIDTAIYFRNIWALVSLCIPESMYSTSVLQWWTQKKYGNQTKQMVLLQLGFYQFLAYHNILGIKRQCGMVLFGDRRQLAYEMGWSFQNY